MKVHEIDSAGSEPSDLEALNEICILGSEEMDKLRKKLKANSIFMNMVIHDMRSPTVSAKLGLESSIDDTRSLQAILNNALKQVDSILLSQKSV